MTTTATHADATLYAKKTLVRVLSAAPVDYIANAPAAGVRRALKDAGFARFIEGDPFVLDNADGNLAAIGWHLTRLTNLASGHDPRGGTLKAQALNALGVLVRDLVSLTLADLED